MIRHSLLGIIRPARMMPGQEAPPAWTQVDLEADWLVQTRLSPESLRALTDRDAGGVVDGMKSGKPDHQTKRETSAHLHCIGEI